jgi:hypothetical protein
VDRFEDEYEYREKGRMLNNSPRTGGGPIPTEICGRSATGKCLSAKSFSPVRRADMRDRGMKGTRFIFNAEDHSAGVIGES